MESSSPILLLTCSNAQGIVASISNFIFKHNGNIIYSAQHTAEPGNILFMRIEWDLKGFMVPREEIKNTFAPLAKKFKIKRDACFSDYVLRIAIKWYAHA
jgi:formyltetrahydrofolate deformylase